NFTTSYHVYILLSISTASTIIILSSPQHHLFALQTRKTSHQSRKPHHIRIELHTFLSNLHLTEFNITFIKNDTSFFYKSTFQRLIHTTSSSNFASLASIRTTIQKNFTSIQKTTPYQNKAKHLHTQSAL